MEKPYRDIENTDKYIIREFDDIEVLEVAIIENIQRADLNPVEEATGYRQLIDKFGHTQEKLAQALGKSRSHIANQMRLLSLPDEVLVLLNKGELTAGHARALITAENPALLAREIVKKGLSVRGAEQLVKKESAPAPKPRTARKLDKDADTLALEADLSAALGMKVSLNHSAGGESGQITIRYETLDELDAESCHESEGEDTDEDAGADDPELVRKSDGGDDVVHAEAEVHDFDRDDRGNKSASGGMHRALLMANQKMLDAIL